MERDLPQANRVLMVLDLEDNHIGQAGAQAMAPAFSERLNLVLSKVFRRLLARFAAFLSVISKSI